MPDLLGDRKHEQKQRRGHDVLRDPIEVVHSGFFAFMAKVSKEKYRNSN